MRKQWIIIASLALCLFLLQPALMVPASAAGAALVSQVDISEEQITLEPGEIWLLLASVEPESAANKNLLWESSKPSVARVDGSGRVIAVNIGSATITASAKDGSGKKAACQVTVRGPETPTPAPTATPAATAAPGAKNTSTPKPTATPKAINGAAALVNTAKGGLNLRSGPSKTSRLVCVIPRDAVFTVITYGDQWSYARYDNKSGYVMTSLFRFAGASTTTPKATVTPKASTAPTPTAAPKATATPKPTATLKPPTGNMARVTTEKGGLNMRTDPKPHASRVCQIPQDAEIEILRYEGDWCFARYKNRSGYVMTKYLTLGSGVKKTASATATPRITATPKAQGQKNGKSKSAQVSTAKGGLNLRQAASSRAARILIIPQNATVQVISAGDRWTEVSYNGKTGYVMTQFLKFD